MLIFTIIPACSAIYMLSLTFSTFVFCLDARGKESAVEVECKRNITKPTEYRVLKDMVKRVTVCSWLHILSPGRSTACFVSRT